MSFLQVLFLTNSTTSHAPASISVSTIFMHTTCCLNVVNILYATMLRRVWGPLFSSTEVQYLK